MSGSTLYCMQDIGHLTGKLTEIPRIFYPLSVQDYLPDDHLARFVVDNVDRLAARNSRSVKYL